MQLVASFPKEVQEGMAGGMKNPAAFVTALKTIYSKHGCNLTPQPKEFNYTLDQVFGEGGDPTVAGAPYVIPCSRALVPFQLTGSMAQDSQRLDDHRPP